jgi:hypothetical protein
MKAFRYNGDIEVVINIRADTKEEAMQKLSKGQDLRLEEIIYGSTKGIVGEEEFEQFSV